MRLAVLALFAFIAGCGSGGTLLQSYVCQPACPTGTSCTANGCISELDASAGPADLSAGAGCKPACSGTTPLCNTSSNTCVGCLVDTDCAKGSVCHVVSAQAAFCVPGCKDDQGCASGSCCGGMCLDTSSDPGNCGACGTTCMSTHAGAACQGGACVAGTCDSGWGDCDEDSSTGCEANLLVDTTNCGACGSACKIANATAGCASTCYVQACHFGWDDCDGKVENGCETSVVSDAKNCGACGNSCAGFPNAAAACLNGACGLKSCNNGWLDCDANIVNGCEVNKLSDVKNCGACGNFCGQGLICVGGSCTCPMCNGLFPHASAKCVNLQCIFDTCNPGWSDCDGDQKNGCESQTASDPKNCGACGSVCPPETPACQNGMCTNKLRTINGFAGELGPDYSLDDWVQCVGVLDKVNQDDLPLNWGKPCMDLDYMNGKLRLACGVDANTVRYIDIKRNIFINKLVAYPERGVIEAASWTMNLPTNDIYAEQNDPNTGRSWWVNGNGCDENSASITVNNICTWDVANCFGQNIQGSRYFYVYMSK